MADDLRRFLEDEPIRARRPTLLERARKWARRNRSVVSTATAAMILALVGLLVLGGAARTREVRQAAEKQRQEDARKAEVDTALGKATLLARQGKWAAAISALEMFRGANGGDEEGQRRIDVFSSNLRFLECLADIRAQQRDEYHQSRKGDQYAQAFRQRDLDLGALTVKEAARRIRAQPDWLVIQAVAALDDWALEQRRQNPADSGWRKKIEVARVVDADAYRDSLRQQLVEGNLKNIKPPTKKEEIEALSKESVYLLGQVLAEEGDPRAVSFLRHAQRYHPGDAWISYSLANSLRKLPWPERGEAITFYRIAYALRPEMGHQLAHELVAKAAQERKSEGWEEGLLIMKKLVELRPQDPGLRGCLRQIEEGPPLRDAPLLGNSEAKTLPRIPINPPNPGSGSTLPYASRLDVYLFFDKNSKGMLTDLELCEQNVESRTARPKLAPGYWAKSIKDCRAAVAKNSNDPMAWFQLGYTLVVWRTQFDEAAEALRKAVELKKQEDYAEAHVVLGLVLQLKGEFKKALEESRLGHQQASKLKMWAYPSGQQVLDCERLVKLDENLEAVLREEIKFDDPAELTEYARFAHQYKKRYADAACLWDRAFKADPKLADDLKYAYRFKAARSAALASCGRGHGSPVDEKERARLREKALTWLRSDLEGWSRHVKGDVPPPGVAAERLFAFRQLWQQGGANDDFERLRDAAELARFSEQERKAWEKLWADASALRGDSIKPPAK